MGGDGGVIANQRKFVRGLGATSYGRNEKGATSENPEETVEVAAKTCGLTGAELRYPVVVCEMGGLYNKESIVEALLEHRKLPIGMEHIRGLKDLCTLKSNEADTVVLKCAMTAEVFNGRQPFVVLWPAGVILSERAVRELGEDAVQSEYGVGLQDAVKLLPIDESAKGAARSAMMSRRQRRETEKREKKKRREPVEEGEVTTKKKKNRVESDLGEKVEEKEKTHVTVGPATSVAAAAEIVAAAKKAQTGVYAGLFHSGNEGKPSSDRDFIATAGLRYTL